MPPRDAKSCEPAEPQDLDWSRESSASQTTSARMSRRRNALERDTGRRAAILCCINALPTVVHPAALACSDPAVYADHLLPP